MIYWPWVVWGLVWIAIAIGGFAWLERRAFRRGTRLATLSFAVWKLSETFPLAVYAFVAVLFALMGVLGAHFFWHWCPPGSVNVG
jgi:hypothetical protein